MPSVVRRRANLLSSRRLLVGGAMLAAWVAMALWALVSFQRNEAESHARERNQLLVRVLEDHAARVLDASSLAVGSLASALQRGTAPGSAEFQAAMRQTLANQVPIRALAVIDLDGLVVAAAGALEPGTRVSLAALQPLPRPERVVLGPYLPGRGLPAEAGASASDPPGLGVLPLVRSVDGAQGRRWLVVALLNPDTFATFQEQILHDDGRSAAMMSYDGQVLAATRSSGLSSNGRRAGLAPFSRFLPADVDQATWTGEGLRGNGRIAAFRSLRQYPVIVVVDIAVDQVQQASSEQARPVVVAGLGAVAMTLMMTGVAARSQRSHEQSQRLLDAAQAEVASRERELSGVFASVREWLFRTDAAGHVELMNARWELTSGRPAREAIGKPLWMLVAPSSREAAAALFRAEANRSVRHAEVLVDSAGGAVRRFDLTVVPLMEQGRPVGWAGSAVDITELLATQAELRAQLLFNASLIEGNPLPMVVLDLQNRYLRVNRAWEAYTGRAREQVLGTRAAAQHGADAAKLHDSMDRQLVEQGGELHYEARMRRADGALRDIYVSKSLISDAEGNPTGIVGTFMDIGEFREAERATRQARDAAEAASRAKSEFTANVSHELRTPLQSILGFSELGLARGTGDVRLEAMFGDIHRAGQRMLVLVNDLLDLSKLDSGATAFEPMRQDVRSCIDDVRAEIRPLLVSKQLEMRLDIAEQPLVANVDSERLHQVLRNLLANAIRFSPQGAAIELAAAAHAGAGGTIQIEIRDRGPGIPSDELESIFEPFVQSTRTKDGSGGTGLGLSISRRLVALHGGSLSAENRTGGGSVFRVTLPAARFGDTRPADLMSA